MDGVSIDDAVGDETEASRAEPWDEEVLTALADEVVRVASFRPRKLPQAPGVLALVRRPELLAMGARTLTDVLRALPGVDVTRSNDGRVRPAIRGLDPAADILLLVDGQRLNDPLTGAAVWELPVSVIERVEVVRGPGSARYGSNAFIGVISIHTRRGVQLESAARFGSFRTVGVSLAHGGELDAWRYAFTLDLGRSDGPDSMIRSDKAYLMQPEVSRVPAPLAGWHERLFSTLSVGRGPVDARVLLRGERWGPYFGPERVLALGSRAGDLFANAWARMLLEPNDTLSVAARVFASRWQTEGRVVAYPPGWAPQGDAVDVDGDGVLEVFTDGLIEEEEFALASFGGDVRGGFVAGLLGTVTAGMEVRHQRVARAASRSNDEGSLYRPSLADYNRRTLPGVDRTFLAPYLEWERGLFERLELTLGLRYDVYTDFGSELSPRGALVLRAWPGASVKLLGATAFRAPTLLELHSRRNERFGNPDLRAESITAFEAVVSQRLLEHWMVRLSCYRLTLDNRIGVPRTTSAQGRNAYLNHAGTSGIGGDAEARLSWGRGSFAAADLAHHSTMDVESDEPLERIASWAAGARWSVHTWAGLYVGGAVRWRGARKPPGLSYFQRMQLRGHEEEAAWLLDVTARWEEPVAGWSVRLSTTNVLDAAWREVPEDVAWSLGSDENLPSETRTTMLELAHHF